MVIRDLGIFLKTPSIIYCDKYQCNCPSFEPPYHARTKHVEVDYHYILEKVMKGDVQVRFVGSTDQLPDIFTKGLGAARFQISITARQATSRSKAV